jgi:hypothetical protein
MIYFYLLQNLKKLSTAIRNHKAIIVELAKVENVNCSAVPFIPECDDSSDDSSDDSDT